MSLEHRIVKIHLQEQDATPLLAYIPSGNINWPRIVQEIMAVQLPSPFEGLEAKEVAGYKLRSRTLMAQCWPSTIALDTKIREYWDFGFVGARMFFST